jgi:hypothetical protein
MSREEALTASGRQDDRVYEGRECLTGWKRLESPWVSFFPQPSKDANLRADELLSQITSLVLAPCDSFHPARRGEWALGQAVQSGPPARATLAPNRNTSVALPT